MITGAVVSDDGVYRYSLWRHWGAGAERLTFVMLNPSTADAEVDDPTIRRCIGFAKREGYDGLEVLNLFAFRATDPKAIPAADDPRGPENEWHWLRVLSVSPAVVAAWGAGLNMKGILAPAQGQALAFARDRGTPIVCLGETKHGAPRHPLYVKGDQPLIPYDWSPR